MFIRNRWYIVAEPDEIASAPLSRVILGKRVVVFRAADNLPVILLDQCPHRFALLSLGTVEPAGLRCRYHGAIFDKTGKCVFIPGQAEISDNVRVPSFPCVERYGYVWGWFGDGAADAEAIPAGFAVSGDPTWIGGYGHFESIKADYRIINDNLIDITHAEFVHPESFGGAEVRFYRHAERGTEFVDRGMTFNIADDSVHFRTHAKELGDEGGPFWRVLLAQSRGLDEWAKPINFKMEVDWWAPGFTSFHITVVPCEPDGKPAAEIYNLHALTPETAVTSHYFYRSIRNYGDASLNDQFTEAASFIFDQDQPILEGQQCNVGDHDLFDLHPVSFSGDHLQMAARKIISRLQKAEA